MERPHIRYARSGDVQIAYQVTGEGPLDVVIAPGTVSHLDLAWEHPALRRPIDAWTAVSRLVRLEVIEAMTSAAAAAAIAQRP